VIVDDLPLDVTFIRVDLSVGAASTSITFGEEAKPLKPSTNPSFNLVFPPEYSGPVRLLVTVEDPRRNPIESGAPDVTPTLVPGQVTYVTVHLHGAMPDGPPPGDAAVSPPDDASVVPDLTPPPVQFTETGNYATLGRFTGIWGAAPRELFVVTDGNTIGHSVDGVTFSWSSPPGSNLNAVWGTSNQDVYAVGSGGLIHHLGASGTWTEQTSNTGDNLVSVSGAGGTLLAVGYSGATSGTVVRTGDGGQTWNASPGQPQPLQGVFLVDICLGIAVGQHGLVQRYPLCGATASSATTDANLTNIGIWAASSWEWWIVGAQGSIFHSSDGGQTWTPQASGTVSDLSAVYGFSAQDVWAVGKGCTILHTIDGGAHWQLQGCPTPAYWLVALWGDQSSNVYAVGWKDATRDGVMLHP
jgi:hypothetical protein